jgi:undecaprenyl-diphosphatase
MTLESTAQWIGMHPVASYVATTIGTWMLAGLLAWVLHWTVRRGRDRWRDRLPPRAWLGIYAGAGAAGLLVAMAAFAELADALDADETLGRFDGLLADALRTDPSTRMLEMLAWVTRAGNLEALVIVGLLVGIALLIARRRLFFCAWVITVAGNGVLIRVLKAIFQRVRPLHEHGFVIEHGWSFPSGHASGSLVTYGMLAYLALRLARPPLSLVLAASLVALFLAIGFSRVFLYVHYFSDVLAGFVSGGAWLVLCIAACEVVLRTTPARDVDRAAGEPAGQTRTL